MELTITATFVNEPTPEEAVAELAKHLVGSLRWRDTDHGIIELRALTADVAVNRGALPNFPASAPLDGKDYDPAGYGKANTGGWPRHPMPREVIFAKGGRKS